MDNTNVKPMRFKKITDPVEYYEWENSKLKEENEELKERLESRSRLMEIREKRYFDLQEKYEKVLDENIKREIAENNDDLTEGFREVEEYWGDRMPMMAMEEAGEFIQAISKLERCIYERTRYTYDYKAEDEIDCRNNLVKEMADMIISIGALMNRYLIDDYEVEDKIHEKLRKEY